MSGQLPLSSGWSSPSQGTRVDPLAPAWPSCIAIFASLLACTKSTMRLNASRCAVFHSPGQPGVMRASAVGQVISTITIAAPPMARAPRCTRWKSPAMPSTHEYCAIGETTMRFFNVTPRSVNGVSIGGIDCFQRAARPRPPARAGRPDCSAIQSS